MCVLVSSTILFETFPILRRNQVDIVVNVKTSSREVPVILVRFSTDFRGGGAGRGVEVKYKI
jgi:hypothetical protein